MDWTMQPSIIFNIKIENHNFLKKYHFCKYSLKIFQVHHQWHGHFAIKSSKYENLNIINNTIFEVVLFQIKCTPFIIKVFQCEGVISLLFTISTTTIKKYILLIISLFLLMCTCIFSNQSRLPIDFKKGSIINTQQSFYVREYWIAFKTTLNHSFLQSYISKKIEQLQGQ